MNPPNTTPLNEEDRLGEQLLLKKILLIDTVNNILGEVDGVPDRNAFVLLGTPAELIRQMSELIQTLEKKARIDELDGWFDLPKHYPGEEYRDEPFAKVKCKLPSKIQYYTLDSGFTYALKVRLNELSAGATAESPNNTTTRSEE